MTRPAIHARYRRPRRGTAYVFVLGVGMLISAMVYGIVVSSQIASRAMPLRNDAAEAEVLSRAALEQASQIISTNALWRTVYTSGIESPRMALGRGTISFKLVDETDGLLNNNSTDPVRVYGYGRVGKATKICSVKVALSAGSAYSCLRVAAASAGAVSLGGTVTGTETISSNAAISATAATLNATNLEAALTITLVTTSGTGSRTPYAASRTYPDATVFDYYKTNGTAISYGSISGSQITRVLLSPQNNPYSGGLNAKGIYVIDCGGSPLTVTSARIVGTLVVLNCSLLSLQTQLNMEPAVKGYPCLLVQGALMWKNNASTLAETITVPASSVNMNPASTPYPFNYGAGGGTSDANTTGSYPTQVSGLVYCSGNLTSNSNPIQNKGVLVVGGTWTQSGTIALAYDGYYASSPPPGFLNSAYGPVAGTWRWELGP